MKKAIDAYQYAITIDEKFDYAYRNTGDTYMRLRKYKDAIEALEKCLNLQDRKKLFTKQLVIAITAWKNMRRLV